MCVCPGGHIEDGEGCMACPGNTEPSTVRNACVCREGQVPTDDDSICRCSGGSIANEIIFEGRLPLSCLPCADNEFSGDGITCRTCAGGMAPNASRTGCECTGGQIPNAVGVCVDPVMSCPTDQVPNASNTDCECPSGQTEVEGDSDRCECPSEYVKDGSACNSCPGERIPNAAGDACVCPTGQGPVGSDMCVSGRTH